MADLTKLGKYEIKRELGKGAMGIVYEGFDPFIERIVAIKTILKSQLDSAEAQDMLNRFRREAQAAGRLAHPNICGIYEYGEDGDVAFIAMEFIKGQELKKMFDEEARFKLPDAVKIMSQLLDALNYSHERGVVHRDIKPANIIITESGQVKVADFGIARIESSHLTQAGTVLGTPTHMSPEQFMGLTVDRRSDIYSAGVILYQFLTGERPFTGSVVTIMHKVLNQEPIAPSALNFSVSKSMDEVVRKALAKKPEDRYQTAAEFSTALNNAAQDLPDDGSDADATIAGIGAADPNATVASAATINTRAAPAKPALKPMLASSAPAEDQTGFQKKKSPMMVVAIVVVVLAVGGAGAWFALRPPSPAGAPAEAVPAAEQTAEQKAAAAKKKREQAQAELDKLVADEQKKLAEAKQEREKIALAAAAQAKADQEEKEATEKAQAMLAKLQQERKEEEEKLAQEKKAAEKSKLDLAKAEQLRKEQEKLAQEKLASAKTAESIAKAKQEQARLAKEREKAEKAKLELAKAEQLKLEKEKARAAQREQEVAKAKAEAEQAKIRAAAAKVATEKARADAEAAEKKRKIEAEAEAKRRAETEAIAAKTRAAEEAEAKRKAAAEADAEAKRKAAAEAEKKTVVASVAPAPAAAPSGGGGGAELFAQGQKLEGDGNLADALKAYTRAANAGYGPAMKKLGDIYGKGNSVVSRDYAASIQWYNKAKQAGADIGKDTIKR